MDSKTVRAALGELQEDPDRKKSWEALAESLKVADGDLSVADALHVLGRARQAHQERGEWEAVAALLSHEAKLAENTAGEGPIVQEQARVLQEELYDEEGALVAYLRILELAPEDATANSAIAESEERRERWTELAKTYLDEAAGAPDDVYKSSMLMRAAEMELRYAGDQADLGRVTQRLSEAAQLDPSNDRANRQLELIWRRQERWEDVATALERMARSGSETAIRARAALRLARLRRNHLDDRKGAAAAYRMVLDSSPGNQEAMSFLVSLYSKDESWAELVKLYETELKGKDLGEQERLGEILQIAMLHWKKLGNLRDAAPWFDAIRKLQPANAGMLEFYTEYCERIDDSGRLLTVLQGAQRSMPDGPEKQQITARITELVDGQKDAQKSIEQYKSLLRQNPDNADARDMLKRLYRQTQGYNALVEVLRQELERTEQQDSDARLRILREVADVYRESIKSDTALVSVLNQVLQIDGQDVESVRELIGLYEKLGRWRDLLTNQQRLAELVEDPDQKAELYRAAGRRWLDQFSNVQNGIAAFEALIAVKPGDSEAVSNLRELYKRRRAWPALFGLLENQLARVSDAERLGIMREMAQLAAERLHKGEVAAKLYREILEVEPGNLEVLDALEKHAERAKDWPTLAEALERRVEVVDDDSQKLAVLQKLGTVYADQMGDHDGAVRAWRRVLAMQPGHPRAVRVLRDSYLGAGDYDGLESLYESQNDWEGLADVLSNTADRTKESATRIELSYRAAAVYVERLNQPDRAFRSYERILATDPEDVKAARALIPLYEADERWARLPQLYELLLGKAESDAEKLEVLAKLVDVCGNRLSDRAGAARYAQQAYELAPDEAGTLERFEEATRQAGTWTDFVAALEARVKRLKKAERRRPLYLKLAEVYARELGQNDDAIAAYKKLLEADPTDPDAGPALESILRQSGQRDDLRWLLGLRAEHAPSDADRVELLVGWAALEEDAFEAPDAAAKLHREILELVPGHPVALEALPRLLLAAGDAEAAAKVLEAHRDNVDGSARVALEVQLAELYIERLSRPEDALAAAVRTLELSEHDTRAISVLQRLVNREETRERAAEVLATEYAAIGDARQEAQALSAMLQATSDRDERLALYARLSTVHEQKLDSPNSALDVTLRALREYPTELGLWQRADALAVVAGRPTDLAQVYREALNTDLPSEVEVELAEQAARLHEERLGDPVGASPYLERVLKREPGNERAFARLKQILTGAERWGELEELYDRTSQATEDASVKVEMLAEVALVCEEIIEDAPKATRYYERILEIEPTHQAAIAALERLYGDQERYADLAGLLERRLENEPGEEMLEIKLRLGRILLEQLHEPARAVGHIEDVLRERPSDYDARELAEKLLEIGSYKIRAAKMLETVYEARDEVRDLVRVLEIRLEGLDREVGEASEPEPGVLDEQRELLRRISLLRDDRLHDDEGALAALSRYVPMDPVDEDARTRLLEIGARAGEEKRVAEVLEKAAERADTPHRQGEIFMQVAHIYEDRVRDVAKAEVTYRRVLELDDNDPELALPAARALERVYSSQDEHERLAEMLGTQIRLESDPAVRTDLLGRLGTLCESILDAPERAIAAWKTRFDEDPSDRAALEALDRLYERVESWKELVRILEHRRDLTENPEDRRTLMRRTAEVLATRLGSAADAIDVWRAIVDEFGPSAEALSALESLFEAAERWEELGDTYVSHLDIVDGVEERLDLLARLGDLRREKLNNAGAALQSYRDALMLDTAHAPSRDALEKLLGHDDSLTRREAAEILHPIYEADGDNERLLRVLEVEIECADDPIAKLGVYEKAIRVADGLLHDPERAFAYADRAVREAAGHTELAPWLEQLDRLSQATGKRSEQVALLRDVVDEIFNGDVQFDVKMKVAALAREELKDPVLAREYYQKALEQRPDQQSAMIALESLYEEADDAASLLDILDRRAEMTESEEEKKQLLFRRARLLANRISDPPRAIEAYQAVLDIELDPLAVEALEKLYTDESRWDDLIELYQRQLETPAAPAADLHVKIARVAAGQLADAPRAFDELEAALEVERQHSGAIAELERVLESGEDLEQRARAASLLEPIYLVRADYDKVMSTLSARLEAAEDPEVRRDLLTRLAQLHEEQKEDYGAALETVARLLHEDLSDEGTVGELERLAKVAGAEKRLAEIYATELSAVEVDEPSTVRLAQRAGEIFASMGEPDRALEFYRRALAFEPESDVYFSAVDQLLQRTERHKERVELYTQALDHRFEPDERLRLFHTIGGLQRAELNAPDEAIDTYRAALDVVDTDSTSLDALTELYRERNRWDDLAELFVRRAENSESVNRAADYRLALARLLKSELNDVDRCIEQLEEIVQAVPTHAEAIAELEALKHDEAHRERVVEILRPLYETADDWRRVIKLNEDRFDLADDDAEKVAVLRETAELWEQRGQDQERARRALGVALELEPDDGGVRGEFERLTEGTGAWNELAEHYEAILEAHPDILSKRDYLATLARVHDQKRDDPRRALDAYVRLRQTDDADLETVQKIEQLATLLSDWNVLVDVLVAKADLLLGDEERASVWRQVGEARRDMLADRDGAVEAYERAAELDPESAYTIDMLIELYEKKTDPRRLVELYEQRVELTVDDDELRFQLLLSAAECLEQKLEDRPAAIDALNRALEVKPEDPGVLASLNRLYRAEERWPELLDNLRLQAERAEDSERRIQIRKQIAEILASKLDSYDEALEAYGQVLEEAPSDEEARTAVRKLGDEHELQRQPVAAILVPVLRLTERYDELVDVLEMRLTTETDPGDRAATLREIARVLEDQLKRPADAEAALLRALTEQPETAELHEEIERLATLSDGWSTYADALSERAQATFDVDLVRDLFARLGRISEERLRDDARAIEAYQRAVEQAGDQPDLLAALDRLYARTGDSQALCEILDRRAALVDTDAEQAELQYRMAVIHITEFKDPSRGLAALRIALERVPDHEEATTELEGLTDDPDLFEEASEVLEEVYRSRGQADRLAALYEKRVGFADLPADRIDMRRNLARVLEEEVGDAAAAQRVLQQGLADDPADDGLLSEIERLAAITGDWEGAATALRDAIDKKSDLIPEVARDLSVRVATWYRDRVEDKAAAEKALFKALEFDPESDEVLVQIEELQAAPGREADLVETLRRRAKLQLGDHEREELYRRAKELADTAGDKERAEAVLRELLEQDDTNAWALEELTALREAAGDFRETFALLRRRVELGVVESQEERRALRHKAAAISREHLDDADQTMELYRLLFEDEPTDVTASTALRELYIKNERHAELEDLLGRLVDVADLPEARSDLRLEQARLKVDQFQDVEGAIELLRIVLDEEPSRADAVVALSELYESSQRDQELADLLNSQIRAASERGDTDAELRFQVRLGEVYDGRLNDRAKAIATYRAVLDRDAAHRGALEALARLFQADGDHEQAAAILERLLEQTEGENAVALASALADEYEALSDLPRAAVALERGLAVDERNEAIRDRLRGLYRTTSTWDKLAALMAGDAALADGAEAQVKLYKEAAEIHAQKREDHAAAAELLERALELAPDDRALMLDLCDAYSASGRGKDAVSVLEKIVESYGGKRSKELGEIHRRLARAYLADGDSARALEELDKAFRIEPGNVQVLKELGEVSLDAGELKKAQQMFRALLLQKLDKYSPITKAEVFMKLGQVHHKLGEKPKAIQMLERAIQTDESLEEAKELLAGLNG